MRIRPIGIVAAIFALLAVLLIARKPLIMDEVLTLIAARQGTLRGVLERTKEHAGNVPLGFLIEHLSLQTTGYSVWLTRIPSALAGIACVFSVGLLAARLRVKSPLMATLLFAAFPLTLRYTLEARPYMLAVLFSVVLTLLFVELSERPSVLPASSYALAAVLTVYTQPFAVLVCGAHFIWAALYRKWSAAACVGTTVAIAAAALAPWYLWSRSAWAHEIAAQSFQFSFTFKTPLMLIRELTGAGYWVSAILAILCVVGAARSSLGPSLDRRTVALLVLSIAVPLLGGLIADAVFGYFLAVRQFLWVLPPAAILAASAWEARPRETAALAVLAVALCGYKSARYFTQPEPDWKAAATAIAAEVDRGACFRVTPEIARAIYSYFAPRLDQNRDDCATVVAAAIPGSTERERDAPIADLANKGYAEIRTDTVGGTFLAILRRGN